MMEKDKDETLFKVRSSRATISAGYRLYMSQFKRIFRYSWPWAVVYALVNSATGTIQVVSPRLAPVSIGLLLLMNTLLAAVGFSLLSIHRQTGAMPLTSRRFNLDAAILWRTVKSWLSVMAVYVAVGAVAGGLGYLAFKVLSPLTALGVIVVLVIVAVVLLLPLVYPQIRYILTDGTAFWPQLARGYPVALRHWGFVFVVVFVASLVETLLLLLLALPAIILSMANRVATLGVLAGDPYGMPTYIGWMAAATFLVIGFIQAYAALTLLFPLYYMYGSIDAQEQERQDFNTNKI